MSASSPASLPPVPAKLPIPAAQSAPTHRLPRAASAAVSGAKSIFDAAPPSTVAARAAAEKARNALQAAMRSVDAAKSAVAELAALTAKDATAASIAEHEGVGSAITEKFTKHAEPLVAAFAITTPTAAA